MKKVLFITPSLCQGGLEHYLITVLKSINAEEYKTTVFLTDDDLTLLPLIPDGVKVIVAKKGKHYHRSIKSACYKVLIKLYKAFKNARAEERYTEKSREYIHNKKVKRYFQEIRKIGKPDEVIANSVGVCEEIAVRFNSSKRYVVFHSSLDVHHELNEKLFPLFDGIVAVSEGVKDMLKKEYPKVSDKIILIENYVDADKVIKEANKATKDIELKDRNCDFCLLSCGRLSKEKGFDLAVDSAKILKENGVSFSWLFLGDGNDRRELEKKISEYGLGKQICITGYKDNPYPYIKGCDIYVQPSYEESYGRTIQEAKILGKPIVSTDTVGGRLILENGKSGVLTPITADGLADGILKLVKDEDLRKSFEKSFNIETNLKEKEKYKRKWEELLGQ